MDVFIGRHLETNQKGARKIEYRLEENKISPQTNKTLQITTGQEKNQVVTSSYWISKNNSVLIGIPFFFLLCSSIRQLLKRLVAPLSQLQVIQGSLSGYLSTQCKTRSILYCKNK